MVLYKTLYRDIERIYYIFSLIHIFPTHISLVRRSIIIVLLSFYHHHIHPKLRLRDEMPKGLISLWIIGQVITRFLPDYYNCEKSNSLEIGHDLFYINDIYFYPMGKNESEKFSLFISKYFKMKL